jgi:hypothetical protein
MSEAAEEARLLRSLNRQPGASPARKFSSPATPATPTPTPATPAEPTVASTHAAVGGWRERRATLDKERAERERVELEQRRAKAAHVHGGRWRGKRAVCWVRAAWGGRSPRWLNLENARIERRFQASLDSAVRVERPPAVQVLCRRLIAIGLCKQFDADQICRSIGQTRSMRCVANPPAWCATLDELRACFDGVTYRSPTASGVKSDTDEGVAAVQDARRCSPRAHSARPARLRAGACRCLRLVHRRQSRSNFAAYGCQGASRQCWNGTCVCRAAQRRWRHSERGDLSLARQRRQRCAQESQGASQSRSHTLWCRHRAQQCRLPSDVLRHCRAIC